MNQMVTRWFHISVECPNGDEFANLFHKGTTQWLECDLPHCVWHLNIWSTVGNALWEAWFRKIISVDGLWGFKDYIISFLSLFSLVVQDVSHRRLVPAIIPSFWHHGLWFSGTMNTNKLFYYKVLCHGLLLQQ